MAMLVIAGLLAAPASIHRNSAFAAEGGAQREDAPRIETWAGADAADDVWSIYGGATAALTGRIDGNGWRLRAAGGYGTYKYWGRPSATPAAPLSRYSATVTFFEVLVGYQARIGALTVKALAGLSQLDHAIPPAIDADLLARGEEYGAKIAVELWLDLGPSAWASLDSSFSTAHMTYSDRLRLGYRIAPAVSLGIEAAVYGHALDSDRLRPAGHDDLHFQPAARAGLFARYEWTDGEISIAGGAARDQWNSTDDVKLDDAYASVNWLSRY